MLWFSGMYKGGAFEFAFTINTNYPHDPPKVKCTQTVRSIYLFFVYLWSIVRTKVLTT